MTLSCNSGGNVRRVNVRSLQHHLADVVRWIERGEEIVVLKRQLPIAKLIPFPQRKQPIKKLPDFVTRAKQVVRQLKGKPLSSVVLADRKGRR